MAIDYGYRLISPNQLNRNGRNLIASEPVCTDIDLVHDGRLFETKQRFMLRGRRKSKRFAVWVKKVPRRGAVSKPQYWAPMCVNCPALFSGCWGNATSWGW